MQALLVAIKPMDLFISSFLVGLVIFPWLYKRIPVLVSPYSKVDLKYRAIAFMVDVFIPLPLLYLLYIANRNLWISLVLFCLYFSFRDALFKSQGLGKYLTGLLIIRLEDGKPAKWIQLLIRNIIFLIPGANLAGVIWESVFVWYNKRGCRLGDKLAQTQVVHGKRVPDLAFFIQELEVLKRYVYQPIWRMKRREEGTGQ